MVAPFSSKFRLITVSGKIAVGTTTLSKNLVHVLNWKHINFGALQREFDRKNGINENKQGASSRTDAHERQMEAMGQKMLEQDKNIVYEAWLSGFLARQQHDVLRVLLYCSHDDIRVDRVSNRESISIIEAKNWLRQRENENIRKWQKLYGKYDFWDPKYFNLIIDTYKTGPMETLGKVLDKLGFRHK
ncbi:cytidylate kinase family protein [Patescibacteria group bacterium]|nr:cytidylate kinase family protein [Patescibacteria group bacterium]